MQKFFLKPASILSVFCVVMLFSSCRVVKNLPPGETLLYKNKFVLQTKASAAEKGDLREDLSKIAAQKPNKRFLQLLPFRMWLYYSAAKAKKLTKFRQWIIDKVGEAPVIYDPTSTAKSVLQMENYLFNSGYFYAQVTDTIIEKKRRTKVYYRVETGTPWKIGAIELPAGKSELDSLVREQWLNTLLVKGQRFNIGHLKNERERIETVMKNRGYYYFSREYINYVLDTLNETKTVNIKIKILPPADSIAHQKFSINNIYVFGDYSSGFAPGAEPQDTATNGEFYFIPSKTKFRQRLLMNAIHFRRGDLYKRNTELSTLNRLAQLGVFRFINVDYVRSISRPGNYLDGIVQLSPAKRQVLGASGEINGTIEGFLGVAGTVSYKNKNLTKAADQLLLDFSGGVQLKFSRKEKIQIITGTFNASAVYYMNKFLVPFLLKSKAHHLNPKTRLSVSYGFEHRFDFDTLANITFLYQLHNFNFAFGYDWGDRRFHHILNPLSVTFFLLPIRGAEFMRRLDLNRFLKSSFEEQIILGPNYTFTYTNQKTNTDKAYMFFRGNIETAGNLLYAGFKLANLKSKDDSVYLIANRRFSQYFRIEGDWRNYFRANRHGLFAIRTFAGIGVPYGNSIALPFVKQYFVGGPNSLRGFLIRQIGPGGYADASFNRETGNDSSRVGFFNQTGDIKFELNAEFRFDIYKWLKAAVFLDAGNVWTLRKDNRELGNFDITRAWKEFAVDAGLGLRLDFDFFVIRLDYGFPIRDPRRVDGKRWQFAQGYAFKKGQFQIAIGYPF
ncbi:MAG: BamA/TamA family outer membrane protein [Bacteroidetes bacterium]|nr:BamA/TamA family outer membrane protein [Bacteroidota bacterium]